MIELRLAGPDDREPVAAFLYERMSSRISLERWCRLFDYGWIEDKPDRGVIVTAKGAIAGYLGVIHAERRIRGRTARTANLSSWYIAMLELATRDPAVTYTTFSSNPPALRLMARVGLGLLDERRLLWRRSGDAAGIEVLSGLDALLPEVSDHERKILADHRGLAVQPHLLCAPEGDALVILSVKQKGADIAYHEVLHVGRPAVLARHAQAFANAVLAPGTSVLAVDTRFLDGFEVVAESEPISVPRFFRSSDLARREVDFLYSEIPLLDLKLY
jgi:hypothetical protein